MAQLEKIGKTHTSVVKHEDYTQVIYHDTAVVEFTDDMVWLNTGGWYTHTTKTRMNQASNEFDLGFQVYQKNAVWYVDTPNGDTLEFTGQGRAMFTRKGK